MIYVITAAVGRELETVSALRSAGYAAHAPRAVRRYRKRGEVRLIAEILFNGYVFIELPELSAEDYYKIRTVGAAGNFLSRAGLPPAEETRMRALFSTEVGISRARLESGRLRVLSGWLKQHEKEIVRYSVRQHKAAVELNIYGKPHRVVCSVDIEKT